MPHNIYCNLSLFVVPCSQRCKASEAKPVSRAKQSAAKPRAKQSGVGRRTGLFCEALNGEDVRSVKQAILFERSELNRL